MITAVLMLKNLDTSSMPTSQNGANNASLLKVIG